MNPAFIVLAFAIPISAFPVMFSLIPIIDSTWWILSLVMMFYAMIPAPCWLGAVLAGRRAGRQGEPERSQGPREALQAPPVAALQG